MVGGRNPPQPGEIMLAHLGVLFLDEIPEFDRKVLETLREPLQAGRITISRAAQQADFPAAIGRGDKSVPSAASAAIRAAAADARPTSLALSAQAVGTADRPHRYSDRTACAHARRICPRAMRPRGESSAVVGARVSAARERQLRRQGKTNRELDGREADDVCRLDAEGNATHCYAPPASGSAGRRTRTIYRVLKVIRTIADLAAADAPSAAHVAEAVQYRRVLSIA